MGWNNMLILIGIILVGAAIWGGLLLERNFIGETARALKNLRITAL